MCGRWCKCPESRAFQHKICPMPTGERDGTCQGLQFKETKGRVSNSVGFAKLRRSATRGKTKECDG